MAARAGLPLEKDLFSEKHSPTFRRFCCARHHQPWRSSSHCFSSTFFELAHLVYSTYGLANLALLHFRNLTSSIARQRSWFPLAEFSHMRNRPSAEYCRAPQSIALYHRVGCRQPPRGGGKVDQYHISAQIEQESKLIFFVGGFKSTSGLTRIHKFMHRLPSSNR